MTDPCWTPSAENVAATRVNAFMHNLQQSHGIEPEGYEALVALVDRTAGSVLACRLGFRRRHRRAGRVRAERDPQQGMLGAHWFPEARLNFAENLLRPSSNADALVFWGEDRVQRRLSRKELHSEVAQLAAALRDLGVVAGDRVAVWLPNMPEAIIAMLAVASIGAIFTSASPGFRRAGCAGSLWAGDAQSADRRRWLLLQRQDDRRAGQAE